MKRLKYAVILLLGLSMASMTSCTKDPDNGGNGGGNNGGGNGTYNGHAYVDLGLPSGTLWATCNVGANTPESYGEYYAWGETTPKTIYDWSTYKYCEGTYDYLTKYCSNPAYGYHCFTDSLTTLLPEDDAATANWGSGWCIPNYEQFWELFNNTTNTWTTQNGVEGVLFTASNGCNLFFPLAGYKRHEFIYEDTVGGYYWLNSQKHNGTPTDYTYGAADFQFYSSNNSINSPSPDRCRGLSIRPVRSTN